MILWRPGICKTKHQAIRPLPAHSTAPPNGFRGGRTARKMLITLKLDMLHTPQVMSS